MEKTKRYELKADKFGHYHFYDNVMNKDMTLENMLNRMNNIHDKLVKDAKEKNERAKRIYQYLKKQYSRLE